MMNQRDQQRVLEELLVLRAQDGDEDALRDLFLEWQPRLVAHAMRMLGDAEMAQDAVQETWVAVIKGIRKLDDPASFRSWILRISTNKCADIIRRKQRFRAATEKLGQEQETTVEPTMPEDSEDEITMLREGLRGLPGDRRAILTMLYLQSMSVSEIAEALDIPVGTVKSRLFHAREHLRKILNQRADRATK